jgi:hypothetical protein
MVDQPEAAAHLERVIEAGDRVQGASGWRSDRWRQMLGEVSSLGGWVAADGHPSPRANAGFVSAVLDGVARPVPPPEADTVGLDVLAGWSSQDRGRPVEAHGVPTPSGPVSVALRWHGDRPALLWERRPWPDRPASSVVWTSSRLDPTWRGDGDSGEALLAVPPEDL